MGLLYCLARHGETADNAARIFQGQGGSGLNRLGRAQASRLAERLRRSPPDAIFASDLERAADTARYVSEACGVPVELDPDLREVDVGAWTGKGHDAIARLYPEEWAAWDAGLDVRRGGGETYAELAERVGRALDRIAGRHGDGARVLVVSHGGAIKSWIAKLLGVAPGGLRVLAGVANAALTVVERDARARHRLHSWNDAAHLEGLVVDEHSD
ncbi:MAG: histidine phosphatase family protein [Labilithrix sp.]|nr:histidine phosphatase family protein [Labilithrix sp.]MBX3216336.1 histidine phosphatase family protein [Labilithrix sp.]